MKNFIHCFKSECLNISLYTLLPTRSIFTPPSYALERTSAVSFPTFQQALSIATANMAMPNWLLKEICEMTIDRFGHVTDEVFNTIMREMPDSIQLNPQRFRNKLDERT